MLWLLRLLAEEYGLESNGLYLLIRASIQQISIMKRSMWLLALLLLPKRFNVCGVFWLMARYFKGKALRFHR